MCCSESQNWLIITVLKFTRNPISIVVYIKTGQRNTIYHRDNEKARKSSEHGPENGKRKFNQTRRRSDNGRSARVDCHKYRKEINTVNRDVTLSVLSLGHFISFSFATKEVKGATYFLSRYSLTQWQFWQANLKWLSGARAQDENK